MALAQSKIGISSVIQPEGHEGESVPLILMMPCECYQRRHEKGAGQNRQIPGGQGPAMVMIRSVERV